jgi:hypothetical protein
MKPIEEMTGAEVRHHMASFHSQDVDGVTIPKLRSQHSGLHKPRTDNPPQRDNGSMARNKPYGKKRGRPPGSKNKRNRENGEGAQTRGGPGPGGVSTGEANVGYPTTPDPTRTYSTHSGISYTAVDPAGGIPGTTTHTAPDSGPRRDPKAHTAPSGANVTGLQPPPPEIHKSQRAAQMRESGANRQQGTPHGGNDRDMDMYVIADRQKGANRQQKSSNTGESILKATPTQGQITGMQAPPAANRTAAQSRKAGSTKTVHSYSNRYDCFGNVIDLAAVPSPTAATRKAALAKGEALPPKGGGSAGGARFPLTNRTLAARAVKMVQFAKGDQAQVRRYIMRVLRKKGWESLIPDNWTSEGQSTSK